MRIKRSAISLVLAFTIAILPSAVHASKFTHVYSPTYTGVYGRVLDNYYASGYLYGWAQYSDVNLSTNPNVQMSPQTGTATYVNSQNGGQEKMVYYIDHEALFIPSIFPGVVESAQSTSTFFQYS